MGAINEGIAAVIDYIAGGNVQGQALHTQQGALEEFRSKIKVTDVGRIINSFIFAEHPDAIQWQRTFREEMYAINKTRLKCPFVCDPAELLVEEDGTIDDPQMSRRFEITRGGFTSVRECMWCETVLSVDLCHDNGHIHKNLKIKNASSWSGTKKIGFVLQVGRCNPSDHCSKKTGLPERFQNCPVDSYGAIVEITNTWHVHNKRRCKNLLDGFEIVQSRRF